jgi:hypothetical protein
MKYHVTTDERLNDIMAPYFDIDSDLNLPWKLKYVRSLDKNNLLFMEDKWTSNGAQMTPMEPFKITQNAFDSTIRNNNLIYSNSGSHSQVYLVIVR